MCKSGLAASACAASLLLLGTVSAQNTVKVKPGGGVAVESNAAANENAAAQNAADNAAQNAADNAAADDQQDQNFFRASELIGTNVKGQNGQSLGQIQDLLIDRRSQQIRYFILGNGKTVNAQGNDGNAQASSNVHVIPWSVAKPQFADTRDNSFVTVPLEQQRLQQAPTYTWQQLQQPQAGWVNDVNRFYNVPAGGGVAASPGSKVKVQRDGDVKIKR